MKRVADRLAARNERHTTQFVKDIAELAGSIQSAAPGFVPGKPIPAQTDENL
jgi:hypothetical protein